MTAQELNGKAPVDPAERAGSGVKSQNGDKGQAHVRELVCEGTGKAYTATANVPGAGWVQHDVFSGTYCHALVWSVSYSIAYPYICDYVLPGPSYVARMDRLREAKHLHVVEADIPAVHPLYRMATENPWLTAPEFLDALTVWAEHFPRPHPTQQGMLAYYASPAHRLAQRITVTRPGRYLKKYFPDMSAERVEELAQVWAAEHALQVLKVTQDADEIEQVYKNGPSSCMSHNFSGQPHPSRVYAGPDLAVAYIGSIDKPKGRAVVWPENKIFGRVYGDCARMEAALIAEGYRSAPYEFDGARIQRIEYRGQIVCPYLDMVERVDDDGEFLILNDNGDRPARATDGFLAPTRRCDDCGVGMDEDDINFTADGRCVCDTCSSENYFYCDGNDELYPYDQRADTRRNYSYSRVFVEHSRRSSFFFCEGFDQWVSNNDDYWIDLNDGRTVCMEWARDNAFQCAFSDNWYADEGNEQVHLDDGTSVARSEFNGPVQLIRYVADADTRFSGREQRHVWLNQELDNLIAEREAQLELELDGAT